MAHVKTAMLLAGMTALFGVVGLMIGGEVGMIIALLFAAGMNVFAFWSSDKMVLRMHNAREVTSAEAPDLVNMVADLARNADMPMPRVYIIETDQPNAFATGRNPENAAVAATTGLLRRLTREEIAGVIEKQITDGLPIETQQTPAWDRWWILAGIIGMWTATWTLRRRSGLV